MPRHVRIIALLSLLTACGGDRPVSRPALPQAPVEVTVIGTNDLHGHVEALPVLGGYLRVLREQRPGPLFLVDGGDMFQGTLESNLEEGAAVVAAYNALGYDAAAVGNHEFDFGPAGDAATPRAPSDDARGALKARAREARFPLLTANLVDRASGRRVEWDNMPGSVLLRRGGVAIGIVGVTTTDTPGATIASNFAGLAVSPLAEAIEREARALRARGADVLVVAAHAGGRCAELEHSDDSSSCVNEAEIFDVARALPHGLVDVIVGGHTHAGVAHRINGIAIIESFHAGRAFGRVDLRVIPGRGVTASEIHPPRWLCQSKEPPCVPGSYLEREISPDPDITALLAAPIERARSARERALGVVVESEIAPSYATESALGNLFADLMRAARPSADVAITNGGGLRSRLPKGDLRYGELYEAMPFDNRFAIVKLSGAQLRELIRSNLEGRHGIISVSGIEVEAQCKDGALSVALIRPGGKQIGDAESLVLVTSDFLATGGDGMAAPGAVSVEDGETIRDAMAGQLTRRGGTLRGEDLLDPARPRLRYPGERPVLCEQ